MTEEQKKISYANHNEAVKYFGIVQSHPYEYDLHHKDPNMKYQDIERYILWLPEDLEVMTHEEHAKLHAELRKEEMSKYAVINFKGVPKSEEQKLKISESNKGKHNHKGANNPNYGKHKHWKLNEDGKRIYYE